MDKDLTVKPEKLWDRAYRKKLRAQMIAAFNREYGAGKIGKLIRAGKLKWAKGF